MAQSFRVGQWEVRLDLGTVTRGESSIRLEPKLMDFGLAKRLTEDSDFTVTETLTRAESTLGTPAYMSPEQVTLGGVDTRSDVFSFGAVLYEMLTGEGPFRRSTVPESITAVINETPPPVSS